MAYMSQENKAKLAPHIKAVLTKFGMKGSISVNNHSTLCVTLKSGPLDIIGNYNQTIADRDPTGNRNINQAKGNMRVNEHWISEHYTGRVQQFLEALSVAMNHGNHDRSDLQSDYFDVGWYVDISVGKWNKDYELTARASKKAVVKSRTLKPTQRVRIILNGISFRCAYGEIENCMDHSNQQLAVKLAFDDLLSGVGTGLSTTKNGFNVQVDIV